jgi:hypothetical protein
VADFDGFIQAHFAAWQHLGRRVSAKRECMGGEGERGEE